MLSCTTADAIPRMFLLPGAAPAHARGRGLLGGAGREDGFSSPAGLHRRPWLGRLRRALAQELFVLHFQPIVSLKDGAISQYEALLRLADGEAGALLAPNVFLPAAERYGLIRDIDRMVLDKVTAMLGGASGAGVRIAVNVSAVSVSDGTLLAHIERALARHEVDPSLLIVEVTETAAISDMRSAREFCAGVMAMGCGLALDDFGAGFGSFAYLKNLPFSHLKIDGEFVRRLPVSRTDQLVVKALAGVVRGMGRETIAEFVGDEPTMSMLRIYGVDYAQGFAIGRPEPQIPVALS
jgi:EAL domain-containing protein (putative c-di-GMP-specific phosphodiesterase class I)